MEAYDLYSGTYVALPEPKAQAPHFGSVLTMQAHDQVLSEKGYDAVAEIVEGTGETPRTHYFDTPYLMLRDPQLETAIAMRERFLEMQPALEAWYRSMSAQADIMIHDSFVYMFDEASELPEPRTYKWPGKLTYEWRTYQAPLTLRERERAHIKTLNGGDQPWKRKR